MSKRYIKRYALWINCVNTQSCCGDYYYKLISVIIGGVTSVNSLYLLNDFNDKQINLEKTYEKEKRKNYYHFNCYDHDYIYNLDNII